MNETNAEFWKYVATQSGLLVALLVVCWSYRKTLLSRIASSRADREKLEGILEKNTEALTTTAVANARQTDATHRLARTVENLDRSLLRRRAQPIDEDTEDR